jgi:cbb3-type cytochrome oxidase maturation protein
VNILLLLIPISLALIGVAIWAFAWAVRRGQFENLDAAALDVLVDDVPVARGDGHEATAPSNPLPPRSSAARGAERRTPR